MVMRARYIRRGRRRSALVRRSPFAALQCASAASLRTRSHCTPRLVMWRYSWVAVLLPALLILWYSSADAAPAPLFGLLTSTNGSGLLETLLLNHVQEKINALQTIADLIAIAANSTG